MTIYRYRLLQFAYSSTITLCNLKRFLLRPTKINISVIRSKNNIIYIILEYISIYSTITSQEAPTEAPKYTRTLLHQVVNQ